MAIGECGLFVALFQQVFLRFLSSPSCSTLSTSLWHFNQFDWRGNNGNFLVPWMLLPQAAFVQELL